jgi:hypothetical protein
MNALAELAVALEVTPKFDSLFFNCKEVKLVVQKDRCGCRGAKPALLAVSIDLEVMSLIVLFLDRLR